MIVHRPVSPPANAVVLSVDEKSQIQALDRTQPGLPLIPLTVYIASPIPCRASCSRDIGDKRCLNKKLEVLYRYDRNTLRPKKEKEK